VPSAIFRACSVCTNVVTPLIVSLVLATRYRVPVLESITGVPVMPMLGVDIGAIDVAAGDDADGRRSKRIILISATVGYIEERSLPQHHPGLGIDGVNRVILRLDEDDIVHTGRATGCIHTARDSNAGIEQRLRIDLPVNGGGEELAERNRS